MPNRPKKWPSYALGVLEEIRFKCKEIERISSRAQEIELDNKNLHTLKALSDLRVLGMQIDNLCLQAYTGIYVEQQEARTHRTFDG